MTARFEPAEPAAGEPVDLIARVRNQGDRAVEDVRLAGTPWGSVVRSAWTDRESCSVVPGTADCAIGRIEPGAAVTARLRLLVDPEPASGVLRHRLVLTAAGEGIVSDRAVSTLIRPRGSSAAQLLALPGTVVTLVAFFGLVLAAKPRPGSAGEAD